LDLNDEPLEHLKFPNTSLLDPQMHNVDRSFMSDFPDEFLAGDSHRDVNRGSKGPASGIDSFQFGVG
jgi:hypothetical protein